MSRQVIIAALLLMMVVPLASAAGLLGVYPRIFTSCPWGQTENPVVFSDCVREAKIQIWIINSHETTVVEGSTDLSSSLDVTIVNTDGDVIAWWDAGAGGGDGSPRSWAPGERSVVTLIWPLTVGPFPVEPGSTPAPQVPVDGYRIDVVWRDFDGSELSQQQNYLELWPESREVDPPDGSFVHLHPATVVVGHRAAVLGLSWCGSLPAVATDRRVEMGTDGTLRLFADVKCGPFASPAPYRVTARLPSLAVGSYPVEFYRAVSGDADTSYQLDASATLEVIPERLDRPGSEAAE